ncbi:MAG: hypothetical protein LBE22_04450 [Azoarcus sp.]|jgi:acetyltransferase-like isoleucine patch superfamily enzyme|nr:hypothetical protein [Azoarcus sp.]
MNRLILISKKSEQLDIDKYEGLSVQFRGQGSTVTIVEGSRFVNAKIIVGNESHIEIGKTHRRGLHNLTVDMSGVGTNKRLVIGNGCSCESMRFAMANESNLEVSLGENCLVGANVTVRPSDGHTIYDVHSGKILNYAKPIVIGSHVWISAGVTFLKGANVPANCIVGGGAIVTAAFSDENCVIAGSPARVVKTGVMWDRRYIEEFLKAGKDSVF